MINEELLNNYQKALQQKYNAVCFDIDGTLTEDNSTKIDSRILPMLANMLKKHIPVVFITGRGETGLNDLLSDITDSKKDKIYFGTSKEIVDKTINNISLIDRLSNSYLGEEVRRKGIDMDKVNSYLDKLDSMEEKKYLSIFNDYIYHVKEKTAFSQLYIADKFLEKKNSIREEFNKLNASLNLSSDDIKSK